MSGFCFFSVLSHVFILASEVVCMCVCVCVSHFSACFRSGARIGRTDGRTNGHNCTYVRMCAVQCSVRVSDILCSDMPYYATSWLSMIRYDKVQ